MPQLPRRHSRVRIRLPGMASMRAPTVRPGSRTTCIGALRRTLSRSCRDSRAWWTALPKLQAKDSQAVTDIYSSQQREGILSAWGLAKLTHADNEGGGLAAGAASLVCLFWSGP